MYLRNEGSALRATLALENYRYESILKYTERGFVSEIVFVVRLYERTEGWSRLFGDRFLLESRVEKSVWWDPFERTFRLETVSGVERIPDAEAMLDRFYRLDDFPIYTAARRLEQGYLRVQIIVRPIRPVAPITLIPLVASMGEVTTPWAEVDLAGTGL